MGYLVHGYLEDLDVNEHMGVYNMGVTARKHTFHVELAISDNDDRNE